MKQTTTRLLFSYWDSIRGERAAPERGDIEPGAIRHILADTFILELEVGRSPEIRLAGTRICAFFGRELRGEPFERLWGLAAANEGRRLVETVVDDTVGLVAGLSAEAQNHGPIDFELILLPLRHRGRTHARVLGALAPASIPLWVGADPILRMTTLSTRIIRTAEREAATEPRRDGVERRRPHLVVYQGGLAN